MSKLSGIKKKKSCEREATKQCSVQFRSVVQSCTTLCDHGLQHGRPSCPSQTCRVYSNSGPLSW